MPTIDRSIVSYIYYQLYAYSVKCLTAYKNKNKVSIFNSAYIFHGSVLCKFAEYDLSFREEYRYQLFILISRYVCAE